MKQKRKLNAMLMHDFITTIETQEANPTMYLSMSLDFIINNSPIVFVLVL